MRKLRTSRLSRVVVGTIALAMILSPLPLIYGQDIGGWFTKPYVSSSGVASGDVDLNGNQLIVADGTAADPSIVFASDDDGTGTGIFRTSADRMSFAINGKYGFDLASGVQRFYNAAGNALQLNVGATGPRVDGSSGVYSFGTTTADTAADTGLSKISAGVVGVGNGTAADVSGTLQAAAIDSGAATDLTLKRDGASRVIAGSSTVRFLTGSQSFWFGNSDFYPNTNNASDVGTSGLNWKTGYFGTSVISPVVDSGGATDLDLQYNGIDTLTISNSAVYVNGNSATITNAKNLAGWKYRVESDAGGTLNSFDLNTLNTNEGAAARTDFTLPTAAAGYHFKFIVQDADGIRITANTGDTIRVLDKVTASAGYIESTTIGSVVTLVAINATEWVATSIHGTWTDGTFTYDDTGNTTP